MTPKILITGQIPVPALQLLNENFGEANVVYAPGLKGLDLEFAIKEVDALVIRTETPITAGLLNHAPNLKLVVRAGVGLDHVDLKACKEKNIEVQNTAMANVDSAAEHTFGLILSLAKQIPQASSYLHDGGWERDRFTGMEIQNKTLGIIGFGNIGSRVAKFARAFSMKVIANDIVPKKDVQQAALTELLKSSDFVTMHVPLTPQTKGMADLVFFEKMKEGSFFVNASRGAVVVEEDLLKSLNSGHIKGAALDVFNKEPIEKSSGLLNCEKVILTPHTAGQTTESQNNMGLEAVRIVQEFFRIKG